MNIRQIRQLMSPLKQWYYSIQNPRKLANNDYNRFMKKRGGVNWDNPKDLIEKIYWLQIYSDTSLWILCADKYLAREYVKSKNCGIYLNELYGVWTSEKEIKWEALPSSFVLKVNNGCGDTIIVKDKSAINPAEICKKLHRNLRLRYGYSNAQLHYTHIPPRIIAERLLVNNDNPNESLVDYKIWCINGEPLFILVVNARTKFGYHLNVFDLDWNNINHEAFEESSKHYHPIDIKRPQSLDVMISAARLLASGIPEVRVDFYEVNKQPIFGEMTFTTGYGYWKQEFYDKLGEMIDLSKISKRDKINRAATYKLI